MDISNYNIEQCDAPSVLAAVLDAHDHPQKIDQIAAAISPIAAAAAAYSEGKPQLAQAITAKGVTTAADASLATMAQNVSAIIQQQTIISGGDAYKQQLFSDADPTKAVLWDLYQVLAQMKTLYLSGESSYTGLLVCEYDKSLDAVDLDKANAWVCSDMVDKTTPILSTDDTHHVWNDANDGKANRWICFLYTNSAGGTFTITSSDAALSPLSIYVGGHINTIEYQTNGKLTELVSGLTENDYVDNFLPGTSYTQYWGKKVIVRGVGNIGCIKTFSGCIDIIFECKENTIVTTPSNAVIQVPNTAKYVKFSGVKKTVMGSGSNYGVLGFDNYSACEYADIPDLVDASDSIGVIMINNTNSLKVLNVRSLETTSSQGIIWRTNGDAINLIDVIVGPMTVNIGLARWNPTNVLADADLTAKLNANIRDHIAARIADGGGSRTITFSQNLRNALETATEQAFATKHWNISPANKTV